MRDANRNLRERRSRIVHEYVLRAKRESVTFARSLRTFWKDRCVVRAMCAFVWRTFLKFDELRFWPSVSISDKIEKKTTKGWRKRKRTTLSKKRQEASQTARKFSFFSWVVLVLLSLVACYKLKGKREKGNLAPHTQKLSLFNIPKTDKTHLYGEQEESDRTRVSRDHQ